MFKIHNFTPNKFNFKLVKIGGISVDVPLDTEYLSVSKNGKITAHKRRPKLNSTNDRFYCLDNEHAVGFCNYIGDWTESVTKV